MPNSSLLCISELHDVLLFICSKYFNVVIVGNFNIPELANYLRLKKANIAVHLNCFSDIFNLDSLKQLISTPNRNNHIIDLFHLQFYLIMFLLLRHFPPVTMHALATSFSINLLKIRITPQSQCLILSTLTS